MGALWRALWLSAIVVLVGQPTPVWPQRGNFEADIASLRPPVAARKPVRKTIHGIVRIDDYDWLRAQNWREVLKDSSKLPPEIRAHVDAENAYAEGVLAPLARLRAQVLAELKGRIEKDDSSVPLPDGPFQYWERYEQGAEHPQVVRAPTGGGPEQILIDVAALAAGKPYVSLGDYAHSPDHRLFAYAIDETGAESNSLHVRDIASGRELPHVIADVADFAWADNSTLYYVRLDSDLRPRLVYRHRLGTDPARDRLVYEEKDSSFTVGVDRTRTGRFIAITTESSDTSEVLLIDAARPESAVTHVAGREHNRLYFVDDWGDTLIIRTNADGAEDFKIVTAPLAAPNRENWRDLVPHRQGRRVDAMAAFAGHLVRLEREEGTPRLVIRRKDDGAEHAIVFSEEAHALDFVTPYAFATRTLRFFYSSPTTPRQTFDYDMESRARSLRKQQRIPSGHEPSAYVVRRLDAAAHDGERVPITVLHRKDLKLDGTAPLYLYGYGAYGVITEAEFRPNVLSLVDRGFVFAIAHVRGAPDKGERWRNAGRREHKANTFKDYIAVAEHLVEARYAARDRIIGIGDSAGGLLLGAVANMRPGLLAGLIAWVPFVDALNTTLDESLPLTPGDFPEWGDPIRDVAAYHTIASYSPYDNVTTQHYPHMLVTAGISDSRVTYWEPAKWIAKLRAMKTNDAKIALVIRVSEGHTGAAGRFESLEDVALAYAFALDVAGVR
jgi:oligopeptidase B